MPACVRASIVLHTEQDEDQMNREQKAAVIDEIAAQISESEAIFAVDYRGTSVVEAAELRERLRDADATLRVVKNSLTERAAERRGRRRSSSCSRARRPSPSSAETRPWRPRCSRTSRAAGTR
jgi:hypothetical protein